MAITAQNVKDLIIDCTVADTIVTSIITDASAYVTAALADCTIMTDAEIEAVTKWVAAHMVASGPFSQVKREKLGEAEVEYESKTGKVEGLESTSYGRMALTLDRCGLLGVTGKKPIKIHAVTSFE